MPAWTRERPTTTGYFWTRRRWAVDGFRDWTTPRVVLLYIDRDGLIACNAPDIFPNLSAPASDIVWCGPIPPPDEGGAS